VSFHNNAAFLKAPPPEMRLDALKLGFINRARKDYTESSARLISPESESSLAVTSKEPDWLLLGDLLRELLAEPLREALLECEADPLRLPLRLGLGLREPLEPPEPERLLREGDPLPVRETEWD
jgi:hypothetical protein